MLKKINDFLAGWVMTAVGGAFLLASFILPRVGFPAGESLAWGCVLICGTPLLYLAVSRLVRNKGLSRISSALLISVAMAAAILINDLFAAGEVAFIMELGALLEDRTTARARKGLKALLNLTPTMARRLLDGKETAVRADELRTGDVLRVLPGETVPADGVIVRGETSIDQSVMTGESLPVDKGVGDEVLGGTLNRFGAFEMEATKVGKDGTLQKLIRLVEEADQKQAPSQRIADKWASILVPVALLIAVAAYFVTGDLVRAVTVLVVFCPCALVLATPTAVIAAIGQATKRGVIVKSGEALEKMSGVKTVAFDKTGTLTSGSLTLTDVIPTADVPKTELLRLAASAETYSEHPLGKAIAEAADRQGLPLTDAGDFHMTAGKGITATLDGVGFVLGNAGFLQENGIALSPAERETLAALQNEGKAAVLVGKARRLIGILALSDVPRPEAPDMIASLQRQGVGTVLLTGDSKNAAVSLANRLGVREIRSELLPEDKVACVRDLKQNGAVCMVGDGVNDAPALKIADVGVAMGVRGSDAALEAADVSLMSDDLSLLPYLKWLSDATVKTIRGAIALSMCINFIAVALSVLGLLTPTTGALVHNAGSCFVVLLAALLYDRKYKEKP